MLKKKRKRERETNSRIIQHKIYTGIYIANYLNILIIDTYIDRLVAIYNKNNLNN